MLILSNEQSHYSLSTQSAKYLHFFLLGQKNSDSDFIFNPNKHAIMRPHDNRLIPESKQLAGD